MSVFIVSVSQSGLIQLGSVIKVLKGSFPTKTTMICMVIHSATLLFVQFEPSISQRKPSKQPTKQVKTKVLQQRL